MVLDKFKKEKKEEIISDEDYVSRKEFNKLKRRIKAHQYYLDNIYIFYSLEPTQFLTEIKSLSYELMEFVSNLCVKHDLAYWLDFDSLLTAVRHNEFMPENLDLSMGMMKSDSLKFAEIFQSEMDDAVLNDIAYEFNESQELLQINLEFIDLEGLSFTINIFKYDYMDDNETIMRDVDSMKAFKKSILFPLGEMQLGNYSYSVPNDSYEYLKLADDNFMFSLTTVPDFNRLNRLRQHPDLIQKLGRYNEMFRSVNENY